MSDAGLSHSGSKAKPRLNSSSYVTIFLFWQDLPSTFRDAFSGKDDWLVENIDIDHGLLAKLLAKKVITGRQKRAIEVNSVVNTLAYFCV